MNQTVCIYKNMELHLIYTVALFSFRINIKSWFIINNINKKDAEKNVPQILKFLYVL